MNDKHSLVPKVLLAIPHMGTMPTDAVGSLVYLDKPCNVYPTFLGSSLIYDARNRFVNMALESDVDYLLFVDSDIVYERNALRKLMSRNVDIVSGIYFGKKEPHKPILVKNMAKHEMFNEITEDFFEVEGCGMGFCLINVDVFRKILENDNNVFQPFDNYGEDYSFCIRARNAGFKIYADATVKLGHIKTNTIITRKDWKV